MSMTPDSRPHYVGDYEAIASYLRTKGVTRCPTACLLPTSVTLSEADHAAVRGYDDLAAQKRHLTQVSRAGINRGVDTRRKKSREFLEQLKPTIEDILRTATGASAVARALNARGILTSLKTPWTEAATRYALVNLGLRGEKLPETGEV